MKYHILTRCSRFDNIDEIQSDVFSNKKLDITWHLIFDTSILKDIPADLLFKLQDDRIKLHFVKSDGTDYLYPQCGEIASQVDGWVYLLDDDNKLHEKFYDEVSKELKKTDGTKRIVVVNQKVDKKDFTGLDFRIAKPENMKHQGVDIAQLVFHSTIFNDYKFQGNYSGDGFLINEIFAKEPETFHYVPKVLSYYNYYTKPKKAKLPKILLINKYELKNQLKSKVWADYEDDGLDTIHIKSDDNIEQIVSSQKPEAIVTIGDDWKEFANLSRQPLQVRNKWITLPKIDSMTGEHAYYCAMTNILNNDNSKLISYFTPIYNTGDVLYRTYESLKNQTYDNWEWVLVNDSSDNGKTLKIAEHIASIDCRVKVYDFREKTKGFIGESKYRAASLCNGYLLCEFDHDDYLTHDCTEWLFKVSQENPEIGFFYSDNVEIDESHNSLKYGPGFAFGYGKYENYEWNGKNYDSCIAPNINPKTIRHIVGVPNHIRAWRKELYHQIGGHNRNLPIADDYELIVRTFLNTTMMRIPKMLYLQYIHSSNSHDLSRRDIQRRVRTIMYHYNDKINERFKELGVEDYCYKENKDYPLNIESRFGEQECYVNKIYGQN